MVQGMAARAETVTLGPGAVPATPEVALETGLWELAEVAAARSIRHFIMGVTAPAVANLTVATARAVAAVAAVGVVPSSQATAARAEITAAAAVVGAIPRPGQPGAQAVPAVPVSSS
jgi:hypothetical protein